MAYISIQLKPTNELLSFQSEVCSKYDLIPRCEFHITIAYLGDLNLSDVERLGRALSIDASQIDRAQIVESLIPVGLGAAVQNQSEIILADNKLLLDSSDLPRVVWISIQRDEGLVDFRKLIGDRARSLRIDSAFLKSAFHPHITLGSNGPGNKSDWSSWDAHDIEKIASLRSSAPEIDLSAWKVQVTNARIHPRSLMVLWEKGERGALKT